MLYLLDEEYIKENKKDLAILNHKLLRELNKNDKCLQELKHKINKYLRIKNQKEIISQLERKYNNYFFKEYKRIKKKIKKISENVVKELSGLLIDTNLNRDFIIIPLVIPINTYSKNKKFLLIYLKDEEKFPLTSKIAHEIIHVFVEEYLEKWTKKNDIKNLMKFRIYKKSIKWHLNEILTFILQKKLRGYSFKKIKPYSIHKLIIEDFLSKNKLRDVSLSEDVIREITKYLLPLKPSKYLHIIKGNNRYLFYNRLLVTQVIGDYKLYERITKFNDNSIMEVAKNKKEINKLLELKNKKILTEKNEDKKLLLKIQEEVIKDNKITTLYIITTLKCNFNCKYCSVDKDFYRIKNEKLKFEYAKKAIDLLNELRDRNKGKVIFYGGEPLLNKSIIKEILQYLDSPKFKDIKKIIITNGSLINKDDIRMFKRYNVNVSISLDGPKEINDAYRIDHNKTGTFDKVYNNFIKLKNAGINPSLSLTLTDKNTKPENINSLIRFILKEIKPKQISVNLMKRPLRVSMKKQDLILEKIFEKCLNNKIYEDRIMRHLIPLTLEKVHKRECSAYGKQITLLPNGKIGICHILSTQGKTIIGDVFNLTKPEDIIYNKEYRKWKFRIPIFQKKCQNCIALGICGGGCAAIPIIEGKNFNDLDEKGCKHVLDILRYYFKKKLDSNKIIEVKKWRKRISL